MRKRSKPDAVDRTSPEYVRDIALRLLTRREHSLKELVWKLEGRDLPSDVVADVTRRLADEGLQSDERFAEVYVRSRAERGYGPRRLKAELRQRGVGDELIERSLMEAGIDWREQAVRYYRRRFGDTAPRDWQEEARRCRALEQHGYTAEQIREAMRRQKERRTDAD
ncbi:MAG: regulatory protein RecX [Gammaproteobacteria bacterium]